MIQHRRVRHSAFVIVIAMTNTTVLNSYSCDEYIVIALTNMTVFVFIAMKNTTVFVVIAMTNT